MAPKTPDYERQAREMDDIAQACGQEADRAHYARLATRLRRKARALAAGAKFQLGEPIVRGPLWRTWWIVLLRAAGATAFGVLTLVWPRHSALALLALFGSYAIFDGLTVLLVSASTQRPRLWLTLGAAVSVVAGLLAFARPRLLALTLVGVLGAWLILRGLTEVLSEASRETSRKRHWSVITTGVASTLFGVGLIVAPKIGAVGLMWAIGAWAVLHGLLLAPFALSLRRQNPDVPA